MRTSRSSSNASSDASPIQSSENQQIFVKLLSGDTIPLTVPPSTTLPTLINLLSLRTSADPSSIRLVYAGKHLTATPTSQSPNTETPPSTENESTTTETILPPTLRTMSIPDNATLHITLPLLGGTSTSEESTPSTTEPTPTSKPATTAPAKSSRPRCNFKTCRDAPQRIVGDCGFCKGKFCGRHRMLEDHKCIGLEDCKRESHERNTQVLRQGGTTMVRGI